MLNLILGEYFALILCLFSLPELAVIAMTNMLLVISLQILDEHGRTKHN